jgi:preprotein translocase subunit SecE
LAQKKVNGWTMDFVLFFKEVRQELAKVIWPSVDDLVGSTLIVLIIIAAFTIYLGAVDYVFRVLTEIIYAQ